MNKIDGIDLRYMVVGMCVVLGFCYFMLMSMARKSSKEARVGQYVAAWGLMMLPIGVVCLQYNIAMMIYKAPVGNAVIHMNNVSIVGVSYDPQTKALVGKLNVDGKETTAVLQVAGRINANGDMYTEECLQDAAKRFNAKEPTQIIHGK